jgi:hypothetical protein
MPVIGQETTPRTRRASHLGSVLARARVIVALVAAFGAAAPGAAVAATMTTITFDDLPSGTPVSTQYDARGVDFANGFVGLTVYCYPVIVKVTSSQAESGTHVADTSCLSGEIQDSSIRGNLNSSAQHVSVYAGFSPTEEGAPASTPVTLTAYDVLGQVVDTSTATVPAGQGTHTLLAVSSSSPNIVGFDVTSSQMNVTVDDLTFDNPSGVPADFSINPKSPIVQVEQGSTASDVVAIQRLNGSNGGVTFSTSALPAGVHASFTPNPASGDSTTMTVSTDSSTPAEGFPGFDVTVTGTPASVAVGPGASSATVRTVVQPVFTIDSPGAIPVPPCSTLHVPIIVRAPFGFTGPVTLTATGVPPDDQASFSPATLSFPGQTQSTLALTSQSDISGPVGNISVTATGGGAADSSGMFSVSRVAPSITRVTDPSGTQELQGGETPQGTSPDLGTVVVVHGKGFCPGSTVDFGNARASAVTQGPAVDGLGPFGEETALRTYVPSLATSGDLYVVPQGGSLTSPGTAATPFTVDSYRDVNGFSFANSSSFDTNVGGYTFADLKQVFGAEQTDLSENLCWPFGDCSITIPIPNPFALGFLELANGTLQGGQCFGFSLASQRLLHGDRSYSAFPLQLGADRASVWNLDGPDHAGALGTVGSSGASSTVAHFIHLMHLEQFSSEALHYWLATATANALVGSQASIMTDVASALHAGDHPLVEFRSGSEGHAVVAYGVDQDNGSGEVDSGDRVIDVYNPNQPFTTDENATDGASHQNVLSTSEIVVHSDGHWEFQGSFSPAYEGGRGSLIVMPYSVVPVKPTLPTNISGTLEALFGSASATQVTDSDGHTLLNSNGSVNNGRATGIPDATQFATLSGTAKPGPDFFLFGHAGTYTTTVRGSGGGEYHEALFARGASASLTAAATSGVKDKISVPASMDGIRFGQTSPATSTIPRTAALQIVVSASDGSQRTATITTLVPTKGQAGAMFDAAHDAVEVTAGGQPTSYTLSLSSIGPHRLPQTFAAPAVRLAAGASATIAPADWSSLQSTEVAVRMTRANGRTTTRTLGNTIRPAAKYTVALKIVKAGATRRLSISTRFIRLAPGSSALMTWEVLKGRKLVAHHTVSLTGPRLHRGLVSRTFVFKSGGSARYTFRGNVELLSPAHGGTWMSQQMSRQQRFRG